MFSPAYDIINWMLAQQRCLIFTSLFHDIPIKQSNPTMNWTLTDYKTK